MKEDVDVHVMLKNERETEGDTTPEDENGDEVENESESEDNKESEDDQDDDDDDDDLESEDKDENDQDLESEDDDENINDENQGPKPIMHTFFQRIDPEHHHKGTTNNQGTGMSNDERHAAELASWEYAWQYAGFDTVILDIEDVKKHENYDEIRNFLDHEAFGEYDELCFLRWFAMVTTGGGWMSDYDVVPLKSLVPDEYFAIPQQPSEKDKDGNNGFPLPLDGKFVVYDSNGRVPSLMSGSAEEWDKMATGLLALAHEHTNDFYSDMYALQELGRRQPGAFVARDQVVDRLSSVMTKDGDIECLKVWDTNSEHSEHHWGSDHHWAVHFSHYNIHDAAENGILNKDVTGDDRPWIEREFIQKWKEECEDKFDDIE